MTTWQYAIIGFSPDLTDPNMRSVPIGVLAVAKSGRKHFAAIAAAKLSGIDPISDAIFGDLGGFLKDHIERQFATMRVHDFPIEALLTSLHHTLRNSLYVMRISDPLEVADANKRFVAVNLVALALQTFLDEIHVFLKTVKVSDGDDVLSEQVLFGSSDPARFRSVRQDLENPHMMAWPLRPRSNELHA